MDDFKEEFSRFPDGVLQIEPQLMEPRILEGGVRFHEEAFLPRFPGDGRNNNPLVDMFQNFALDGVERVPTDNRISSRWMLDMNMPLMQLFLASLLPWYHVPARRR